MNHTKVVNHLCAQKGQEDTASHIELVVLQIESIARWRNLWRWGFRMWVQ